MDKPNFDGIAHIYPIDKARRPGGGWVDGSGFVRWEPKNGVTFQFHLKSHSDFPLSGRASSDVGRVYKNDPKVGWEVGISEGRTIRLWDTEDSNTPFDIDDPRWDASSVQIHGRAQYATALLNIEDRLSHWYDTPSEVGIGRLYCPGVSFSQWPESEPVEYKRGSVTRSFHRSWVPVDSDRSLSVYKSSGGRDAPAVWVVYQPDGTAEKFWYDSKCHEVRQILSFLVGAYRPFCFRDQVTSDGKIDRTYLSHTTGKRLSQSGLQPIPVGETSESLSMSAEIVQVLPDLLLRYRSISKWIDFDWIAGPLWSASDTFISEQIALACISLERLMTAVHSWKKAAFSGSDDNQAGEDDPMQPLIEKLRSDIDNYGKENKQIDKSRIDRLKQIVANYNQPSSKEKVRRVFEILAINLSQEETTAIASRNVQLHGRATMPSHSVEDVDQEKLRFDTLKTIINKGLLSALQYKGPWIDYSKRPSKGEFPLYRFENVTELKGEELAQDNVTGKSGKPSSL